MSEAYGWDRSASSALLSAPDSIPCVQPPTCGTAATISSQETYPYAWASPALNECVCELLRLLRLPAKWDSYGASAIESDCIESAILLLQECMTERTPAPSVVPTSKGGVQLEWHTGGVDLDVEVEPSGQISVFCEDANTDELWEEDSLEDLSRLRSVIARLDI